LILKFDDKNLIEYLKKTSYLTGFKSYIVGGYLRDYFLGFKNYDIDITVEGDGINFAETLNSFLKGSLKTYSIFNTATIKYKNIILDIVSARKEYYIKPAVLPKIEFSDIYEDLKRRDFTINTIAYDVLDDKIIDYFGGLKDLEDKKIKILHNKSFIDDPTRIFRGIKYSIRYDFLLDKMTEDLLIYAINSGYLKIVSPDRIRNEFFLILKEKKIKDIIEKLIFYRITDQIFKDIQLNTYNLEKCSVQDMDLVLCRFLIIFYNINLDNLEQLKYYLNLNKYFYSSLKKLIEVKNKLNSDKESFEVLNLLDKNIIKIFDMMGNNKVLKILSSKPAITGKDIRAYGIKPGPLYSKILKRVFDAKYQGIIYNKNDEIKFLQELITKIWKGEFF